jgi:hypothetical protein
MIARVGSDIYVALKGQTGYRIGQARVIGRHEVWGEEGRVRVRLTLRPFGSPWKLRVWADEIGVE